MTLSTCLLTAALALVACGEDAVTAVGAGASSAGGVGGAEIGGAGVGGSGVGGSGVGAAGVGAAGGADCEPTVMADGLNGAQTAITSDEAYVYVGTINDIVRVSKDGSGSQTIPDADAQQSLAMDADYLFSFLSGGGVFRVNKDGSNRVELDTAAPVVGARIALDSTHVYWITKGTSIRWVRAVPKAGGAAANVVPLPVPWGPAFLLADETHLFFVGQDSLNRVDKDGGNPITLIDGPGAITNIVMDDQDVYYANNTGIWRIAKDGNEHEYVSMARGWLALDEDRLYVASHSSGDEGTIGSMTKDGSDVRLLGIFNVPGGLVVDATHVYVIDQATARLWRFCK